MSTFDPLSHPAPGRLPRFVPFGANLQALVGGFLSQFGWAFFTLGMIFFWIFEGIPAFHSLAFFTNNLKTGPGIITGCQETFSRENNARISRFDYSFTQDNQEWQGSSYSTKLCLDKMIKQEVIIETIDGNPAQSRIQDMRTSPSSLWVVFMIALFPLIGLICIIRSIRSGLKSIRLMKFGMAARGCLISSTPTLSKRNGRVVMALTFEFLTQRGDKTETVIKNLENLEVGEERVLFYDTLNPGRSCLLDDWPMKGNMNNRGDFMAPPISQNFKYLLLPFGAIISNSIGYYFAFLH
ncbi:hypothetical protein HOF92_07815 [bacterium]|jgi:hypothetical protein|nr:hypothetical protein [bacterium]